MGEETKVKKMFMTLEDRQSVVFEGIKDIQFTECIEHDYYDDTVVVPSLTVTFEAKYPKFFHCTNRKRYKKLLMSLSKIDRNYIDGYLKCTIFGNGMRIWLPIRLSSITSGMGSLFLIFTISSSLLS